MLSPEPIELPFEFLNMKYSQLNKVILSMSSHGGSEDTDTDEEKTFRSVDEGDAFESPFEEDDEGDDELNKTNKRDRDEDNTEVNDVTSSGISKNTSLIIRELD